MKVLLCLLALLPSLRQVDYARFQLNSFPEEVLDRYENANFVQLVRSRPGGLEARTRSLNFLQLDLNYRVHIHDDAAVNPSVRRMARQFLASSVTLKQYLTRIRDYLISNVEYSPRETDQSPAAVLERGTADCVGMTSLVGAWLDTVGVEHRGVSGFYFQRDAGGEWTPQPHRWLEIRLPDGFAFFFDPQFHMFSPRYLVVRPGVDFRRVRRFRVMKMKLQTKLENG